jgi:alkaline phosphatase D
MPANQKFIHMKTNRRKFLKDTVMGAAAAGIRFDPGGDAVQAKSFSSAWPAGVERVYVGPEYWANRLQDWRIRNGRLECVEQRPAGPMRTLHLLTHRLSGRSGGFEIEVRAGVIDQGPPAADAASGFLIGAGGRTMDYRAAALIHHQPGPGGGLFAGFTAGGAVFIRDFETPAEPERSEIRADTPGEIRLRLNAAPDGDRYRLTLTALTRDGRILGTRSMDYPAGRLIGSIALVSHPGAGQNTARYWFRDWHVRGEKIDAHPDRVCGPILSVLYTVHGGVLKLTAQLMPVEIFARILPGLARAGDESGAEPDDPLQPANQFAPAHHRRARQ